jgi:glycosyltransferase involved in cell wall biosynthesis
MQQKVLYVITKSNWGGAQRYVFDLSTHMGSHGFEVAVALGGTGERGAIAGLLEQKLRESGVRTIFVKSFMRDVSFLREFGALAELVALLKKEKPDVVHLNSTKAGAIGALAARIAGVKKIIFTAHGWPFRENRNVVSKALLWLASYITGLLSTTVICVSEFDLTQARRMPGVHAVRIYNGIDLQTCGLGDVIRHSFPDGVHITGTIGELNKNKNQIALIEQAKNDPAMYVAIVGEGENKTYLKKKIEEYKLDERVKLFGFMDAKEVLKGFDTFALPSLKEGLPYVLIEAKAAGLPIVANRTGGVGEILDAKDMSEFSLQTMLKKTATLY